MTVPNGRSRRSKVARKPAAKNRKGRRSSEVREVGWGFGSEQDEEDIFMRRALFSVLVAVVTLVGGWFMLTAVTGKEAPKVLSANDRNDVYTIRLLEFPNEEGAMQFADEVSKRSLAPREDFHCVKLRDGTIALCVGRFEDVESAELQELRLKFRSYVERGSMPFAEAAVYGYSD